MTNHRLQSHRPEDGEVASEGRLRLLGPPTLHRIHTPERPLERKLAAALALAASGAGRSRERVAGLLWPESGDSTARTNLRVLLHRAKETFGLALIAPGPGWALAEGLTSDLAAPGADALRRPLLEGCTYDDLEELQRELDGIQARLRGHAASGSLSDAEVALLSGTRDGQQRAASLAQAVLAARPTDEAAARLLMKAQVALGQRNAALATYERLRTSLSETLGTQPDRQTRLLQLDILRDNAQPVLPGGDQPDAPSDPLRSPRAVGREGVIEQLLTLGAQKRYAWIEGDAGVGKSRVIEELLLRTTAVRVRCRPSDGSKAYAVLRRLIGQIELERPSETQASMGELLKPERENASIDLQDVFDGVVETLQRLRRDGVTQLVVEDVHYLDSASGRLFNELSEAMTDDRALAATMPAFVFTARPQHDNATFLAMRQAVQADPNVQRIVLQPLALTQTQALVQALLPTQPWLGAPGLAERLHAMSGGNAYFSLEIIRAALATPDPKALAVRVDSVQQLLGQRLQAASAEASELAGLLAVAQSDFDARMPKELLGQDSRTMARAWQELVNLGLFKASGFAHDLALAAAHDALIGPQAQLMHEQVADFIERHGGSDERVAQHRLQGLKPEAAVPAAWATVQRLIQEGAEEQAGELIARARDRVPALTDTDAGWDMLAAMPAISQAEFMGDPAAHGEFAHTLYTTARLASQGLRALAMALEAYQDKPIPAWLAEALRSAVTSAPVGHWGHAVALVALFRSDLWTLDERKRRFQEVLDHLEHGDCRPDDPVATRFIAVWLTNCTTALGHTQHATRIMLALKAHFQQRRQTVQAEIADHYSAVLVGYCGLHSASADQILQVLAQPERRGVLRRRRRDQASFAGDNLLRGGRVAESLALARQEPLACQWRTQDHWWSEHSWTVSLSLALGALDEACRQVMQHGLAREERPASDSARLLFARRLQSLQRIRKRLGESSPLPAPAAHWLALIADEPAARLAALGDRADPERLALAQSVAHDLQSHDRPGYDLEATILLAGSLAIQGRPGAAHEAVASALGLLDRGYSPPHDLDSLADFAHDLWLAMRRSRYPQADGFRARWNQWRDTQTTQLPPEWHASFRWRHAWVSDLPSPRPTTLPRLPWQQD